MNLDRRQLAAVAILVVALMAALVVAVTRVQVESQTRRVELAMDLSDFLGFARSYNYDPDAFLIALRRAGLTSLAVSEELGGNVNTSPNAFAASGQGLIDSARLSPPADPTLAALLRAKKVSSDAMYLIVWDRATFARYRSQLPLHLGKRSITVLHDKLPYVIALRTQADYFNNLALGIPDDQRAMARRLGLLLVPRIQNDERIGPAEIAHIIGSFDRHTASTVVFFGLRNQVLGEPDNIEATAQALKASHLNFGLIETYDQVQVQKGSDHLGRLIPGQTTRVQAISKLELDKLLPDTVLARYLLGVRERNVRVVYLRPYVHEWNGMSIEKTNVALVSQLASALHARGFTLGRATPIPLYRGNNRLLVGLSALAVPALVVLLCTFFGWRPRWLEAVLFGGTIALYVAGLLTTHDITVRVLLALAGAIAFATAAVVAIRGAFFERPERAFGAQIARSARYLATGIGVALAGGIVVVGLLSTPLLMEEIAPFRGVKLLLVLPPLLALALYLLTDRFNAKVDSKTALGAPVRIYQLLAGAALVVAALLIVTRSGNQSDLAPSTFELSLRSGLTTLLSVRPRFKEFLVGFPLLMLLPALLVAHRRAVGWLFVIAIGIGLADVVDTFSHLHTPLLVSLTRLFNGALIGALIGIVLIAIYRRWIAPSRGSALAQ